MVKDTGLATRQFTSEGISQQFSIANSQARHTPMGPHPLGHTPMGPHPLGHTPMGPHPHPPLPCCSCDIGYAGVGCSTLDVRVYVAVNFNATLTIIESCLYGLLLRAQQVHPNIGQNAFLKFRLSYRK